MSAFKLGLAALTAAVTMTGAARAAEVTVTLTGVEARGGEMLVSLQTAEEFMQPRGHLGAHATAEGGVMTLTVHDVPPGDYAVMVMHDVDGDFKMARDAGGKPREGWAMSGPRPAGRKPTFTETKITVPADGAAVTLPMVYPAP